MAWAPLELLGYSRIWGPAWADICVTHDFFLLRLMLSVCNPQVLERVVTVSRSGGVFLLARLAEAPGEASGNLHPSTAEFPLCSLPGPDPSLAQNRSLALG